MKNRDKERKHQTVDRWVRTYSSELYRFARVRLSNRDDAEDAVQKTFIKAFKSFENLRQEASERAWLYAILTNVIKDELALAKRRPQTVEDEEALSGLENISDGRDGPDEVMSRQSEFAMVGAALASLPETFSSPLIMREVSDMKYDEIAKALMIPVGTVMSRLYRARKALAEILTNNRTGQEETGSGSEKVKDIRTDKQARGNQ
jgi:RNA polymerase sigma-70 factor (ECF subfamily)